VVATSCCSLEPRQLVIVCDDFIIGQ